MSLPIKGEQGHRLLSVRLGGAFLPMCIRCYMDALTTAPPHWVGLVCGAALGLHQPCWSPSLPLCYRMSRPRMEPERTWERWALPEARPGPELPWMNC